MVAQVLRGAARTATFRGRYIGRDAELAAARFAFEHGESLVSVTGTGGIGKSRFAHEFVLRSASDFAGGSFVCDLSEARDRADLFALVARALGVAPTPPDERAVEALGGALGSRGHALLVLDNFEQLVPCATDVVESWLEAAPEACVLVATRERLRLDAEVVIALEPLRLPTEGQSIAEAEAVELFVDRARRVRSDFSLSEGNAKDIAALVVALDGLPLAIELAAARAAMLDAKTLRERARSGLDVLSHGARLAPERQSTMRGALDWSWSLLTDDERAVFAQCSVFRGGFDLDAAERVLRAPDATLSIIDLLQSLHDKSLLRARPDGDEGGTRFDLFLTVREFAAEKLAEIDTTGLTAARHASHYARLGHSAPDDPRCVSKLVRERDNLIAAAEHGLHSGDREALWAIVGLETALSGRAFDAPSSLVERALTAVSETSPDHVLHGWLLYMRVRLRAIDRGRFTEAELDDAARALEIGTQRADPALTSTALRAIAQLHVAHGDAQLAVSSARASVEALRDRQHPALSGAAHSALATALLMSGELDAAARTLEHALALHEESAHTFNADLCRGILGVIYVELGDHDRARAHLRVQTAFGDRRAAHAHGFLGLLSQDERALDAALEHYATSIRLFEAFSAEALAASFTAYEALARADRGELAIARERIDWALARLRPLGASAAMALSVLGVIEALRGRLDAARTAFDEAQSLLATSEDRTAIVTRVLRAHEWLAAARAADAVHDRAASRAHEDRARALLATVDAQRAGAVVLRIAAQSVASALDARVGIDEGERSADVLVVHRSGDWFDPPGGTRVECYARPVLRSLLRALVEQHRARPGEPLSNAALIAAAWPGQKMKAESAKARLHTALKVLRQLGLREHLRATQGGYALGDSTALRVE
ncbi:MAG: hypothetical protein U0269_21365 [Polyangiales bacterium]